jgi:hypothetical protein
VDVSHYSTSSFVAGLGKFNGALQKYSEVLESVPLATNAGSDNNSSDEGKTSLSGSDTELTFAGPTAHNAFNDAARNFIDAKIASGALEMLVFEAEIIFVDKAALSANNSVVSWQLEDGGLVSMIGLSSDMAEFLVA